MTVPEATSPGHLWLIGMMGSGKSTVGALLAERRGTPFDDTDRMVEAATAMSLPALWAIDDGVTFRLAEAAAVAAVAGHVEPSVIAAGGGTVLDAESVERMRRSGVVVWLEAEPSELAARVEGIADRPLLSGEGPGKADRLAAILGQRRDLYRAASDHRVTTDGRSPEKVSEEVGELWLAT